MKLNIQRFALSINVSGSLKIQIQPLENKKAELEKEKNKVEDFINKIAADLKKAIESADAETKENLEKYKAEFEKQKENIREMISDTQKKIDGFIQAVVKKHTAVQTRFGQILVEYGNKLKAEADGATAATATTPTVTEMPAVDISDYKPAAEEPATPAAEAPVAETPVAQPAPAKPANPFNQINNKLNETKSILRQKIEQLSNTIKTNNNAFKEKITSGNAFGSIKNLFDNTNSAINNLFKRR